MHRAQAAILVPCLVLLLVASGGTEERCSAVGELSCGGNGELRVCLASGSLLGTGLPCDQGAPAARDTQPNCSGHEGQRVCSIDCMEYGKCSNNGVWTPIGFCLQGEICVEGACVGAEGVTCTVSDTTTTEGISDGTEQITTDITETPSTSFPDTTTDESTDTPIPGTTIPGTTTTDDSTTDSLPPTISTVTTTDESTSEGTDRSTTDITQPSSPDKSTTITTTESGTTDLITDDSSSTTETETETNETPSITSDATTVTKATSTEGSTIPNTSSTGIDSTTPDVFTCEKSGFFAISGTTCSFLQCLADGSHKVLNCHDGYHFDSNVGRCILGACSGSLTTTKPDSDMCPSGSSGFIPCPSTTCSFIQCIGDGTYKILNCNSGYHFDINVGRCILGACSGSSATCTVSTTDSPTTPSTCTSSGFFEILNTNCKFLQCFADGTSRELECSNGYHFDISVGRCILGACKNTGAHSFSVFNKQF